MSIATKSAIRTASLQALATSVNPVEKRSPSGRDPAVRIETDRVTRIDFTQRAARGAIPMDVPLAPPVTSRDSRYTRFVDAVQALRIDVDLSTLTLEQIDRIMQSAQRMYVMNDGVPEPVTAMPPEAAEGGPIPATVSTDSAADTAE